MSHAPSLLFPSHLSTTSLSTCTPVRPATRPSSRTWLMSPSHGDLSIECLFRPLGETHSPTGYEPTDLAEEDTSMLVKPTIFHRPSMTSTSDSAESLATHPPESDLDDEEIRNMLASPLYLQEGEASADRSLVYHSFRFISFQNKCGETCRGVLTQKKVESRISLRQRRYSVGTSSSLRRKWSSIQTVWSGRSCETGSWRTKRSSTRRSKICNLEARM